MPLYEYQCQSCGRRFEKIRKFSDPPLEICPHCGGKLEKLISSPAFHLKGTGWYATDYARKSESGSSKSGDSAKNEKGEKNEKSDKGDKAEKGAGSESSSKDTGSSTSSAESSSSSKTSDSGSSSGASSGSTPKKD